MKDAFLRIYAMVEVIRDLLFTFKEEVDIQNTVKAILKKKTFKETYKKKTVIVYRRRCMSCMRGGLRG
ncbi:MAG: hypothetical protein N2511_05745 [Thermodesulfovibrionales bacterium]|nr:hypothetical protein [Thermodesulfovibrionales bacterium]